MAMVNGSRRFDGLTRHFHAYLRGLDRVGITYATYTCVDPSERWDYPAEGTIVPGYRVPGGGRLEMGINRLLSVFARRLRDVPGDLVHVGDPYLAPLARYRPDVIVNIPDLGKLTTRWYPWPSSLIHNLDLRAVARARGVVCSTDYVRQEVLRRLPIPADAVRVAPLHSLLPPGGPRDSPDPPTEQAPWNLLYVGADRPHKNLPLFLEVLRVAGAKFRGTLVSRLSASTAERIRRLGLGGRMTVLCDVNDLTSVYRDANVLVFPSFLEGFGLPLVEAMGQRLPILASSMTSVPEVVGSAGILLDPTNPADWIAALERLQEPTVYQTLSRASWERSQTFTADRTGAALREAYEAFLNRHASERGAR